MKVAFGLPFFVVSLKIFVMEIIAALLNAIFSLVGIGENVSMNETNKANQNNENHLDRQFTHSERIEQNQYAQQMHEFNMLNDPRLQMSAYRGLGMSQAAALQAIGGTGSTTWNPASGSSSAFSGNPLPHMNTDINSGFSQLQNAINSVFDNELKRSETEKNKQDVVYTQHMIDESNARIVEIGHKMGIEDAQIELATAFNQSQIGLNTSQIALNVKKLDELDASIQQIFSTIENIDADTVNKYLEASKIQAQTVNIQADTVYKQAQSTLTDTQTQYVESQTLGLNIENQDKNITLGLRRARYEASKILGVDVDAPVVTQFLMSMAFGQYSSTRKVIEARTIDDSSVSGVAARAGIKVKYDTKNDYRFDKSLKGKDFFHGYYPSFIPVYNP